VAAYELLLNDEQRIRRPGRGVSISDSERGLKIRVECVVSGP